MTKRSRISWPFKTMQVGDAHIFPEAIGPKAQAMAHIYGRTAGVKFTTQQQADRTMRIERIY